MSFWIFVNFVSRLGLHDLVSSVSAEQKVSSLVIAQRPTSTPFIIIVNRWQIKLTVDNYCFKDVRYICCRTPKRSNRELGPSSLMLTLLYLCNITWPFYTNPKNTANVLRLVWEITPNNVKNWIFKWSNKNKLANSPNNERVVHWKKFIQNYFHLKIYELVRLFEIDNKLNILS